MNKKISIISAILFVVGLFIVFSTLIAVGFNFDKIAGITMESFEIKDGFEKICADFDTADIIIKKSSDERCVIETITSRGTVLKHSVAKGELKITEERDWGFSVADNKMTLYLPEKEYSSLVVNSSTSDVKVEGIDFKNAKIIATTADVEINSNIGNLEIELSTGDAMIKGMKTDSVTITTSTGDIKIFEASVKNSLSIKTKTGETKIKNTTANNMNATVSTGDVELESVVLTGKLAVKGKTSDIELEKCDAQSLNIETSTGDVEGELLSNKIFYVTSSTGDIFVPKSTEGGMCEVKTSTGDVSFKIEEKPSR